MRASIAMATYNGCKYLKEQLDSIIIQLSKDDELVISDDGSTDGTVDIIEEYAKKDNRIKVFYNKDHSKGLVSNFENALKYCKGQYILFSDQDDVWLPGKIDKVCEILKKNNKNTVVIHDAAIVDFNLKVIHDSTFLLRNGNTSLIKNLIRLSYIGCCMGFKREMLDYILPIPIKHNAHDWWTGSICCLFGNMELIPEKYILHRMHNNNATPKKRPSIFDMISIRIEMIEKLFCRWLVVITKRKKNYN